MFSQQRFFTNQKGRSTRGIGERELWSQQQEKYDGCCGQLQQRDGEGIFQVWLYCDQPLACYMQIHSQFTAKATVPTVDKLRSSGKQVALIGCWMGIEQNGKITLCSRQNKYCSSQFRVRFLCVKQLREEVQLILVSQSKGSEIKLAMEINSYIWLLRELNLNKIRFYSEPLISIPEAWKMLEKYLGTKLQWVCACTYNGQDTCFVVRINYRLFIYKVQRAKIELVHVIGANQSLREKADREWCFIGQKWIAFRSISDRQLYKIYYTSLHSQAASVHKTEWRQVEHKTEWRQVEERQVLTEKQRRSGSRHATEVNSISSKALQERMEDKMGEDECKQATIHKRLEFSMRKETLTIQQSQRQMEANQEEQVMVDEHDRIIVQDNQFDQQQDNQFDQQQPHKSQAEEHKSQAEQHKSQAEQHGNAIDEEMLDQQIQEQSELKQQEAKISIEQIKVEQPIEPKQEAHQDITVKSRQESITRKVSWSNHKSNRKEIDHYDKQNCSKAANSINRHTEFKQLKIEEQQISMSEVSQQPDIAMDEEIIQQNQSSDSNLFGFELIAHNDNKCQQKSNSKQQHAMIQQECLLQKTTKLKTIIKSDYFLRNTHQETATTPKKYKHSRTYTQQPQPSTKLHPTQIIKQAASGQNYLADVMQVDSDIFAILNSRHEIMLCSSDKLYDYNANGVRLSWKRQTVDPTKLFPSLAKQHLHYLQNSMQSIFSYDLNKQKHTQLINYGLLVDHNRIRDVTQTNQHEYIVITPTHIKFMDSRLKQYKSRQDLSYRSEHNSFQKIVMQSPTTAVVSQSDGLVKIFDLRASSLRALNRLVLHQTNTKHQQQEGMCSQLKIVGQSQDIFCTYNNRSYLIASQTINSQYSLYQRTARYADRQQINLFNLTTGINQHCFYDINKAGDKIVHWQDGVLKYCEASSHKMKTLWRNSGEVGYVGFDVMGERSREDVVWCLMGKQGFSFRRCPIE